MAITALPTPPSRSDPANFIPRADAFHGALPTFATEANALQADVNAKQLAAEASATAAAASADSSASSATSASGSVTAASTQVALAAAQVTLASNYATASAASLAGSQAVNSKYLSPKSSDPAVNDTGGALSIGLLYFNTTTGWTRVYTGLGWANSGSTVNGIVNSGEVTATSGQTVFAAVYDVNYISVFVNGLKLRASAYSAINGTSFTLVTPATVGDIVSFISYGNFQLSTVVTSINGTTGAVTLPPSVINTTYAGRTTLRALAPIDNSIAFVQGLGLFIYVSGSSELDDDETCLRTSSGAWELNAASPDYIQAYIASAVSTRKVYTTIRQTGTLGIGASSRLKLDFSLAEAALGDVVVAYPGLTAFSTTYITPFITASVVAQGLVRVQLSNPDSVSSVAFQNLPLVINLIKA